jgi:hypothetical protein
VAIAAVIDDRNLHRDVVEEAEENEEGIETMLLSKGMRWWRRFFPPL